MKAQPQPPEVQILVDEYGFYRVYETWMKIAGFPPTWDPDVKTCLAVQAALK